MHAKEILPQIAPTSTSQADRFSLNLWRWVRKACRGNSKGQLHLFVAIATKDAGSFDPTRTQASSLYIGLGNLDEGWLHGSRLSEILCTGVKASGYAYPPRMKFEIIADWWERYIVGGKCFIDPAHTLYFDRERWQESADGKERTCLWCGKHKQHLHAEMVEKTDWRNPTTEEVSNV